MNFVDIWYYDISFVVNHSIYYEDIPCEVAVASIVQLKEIFCVQSYHQVKSLAKD
jgi:deoxycytidylate deaminase